MSLGLGFSLGTMQAVSAAIKYVMDLVPGETAYGLQTLINGYNGPLIRVRRENDNAELDIYAVGDVLDGQAILDFCAEIGTSQATVTTWYNQTGKEGDYDLTQPASFYQPVIVRNSQLVTDNSYIHFWDFDIGNPNTLVGPWIEGTALMGTPRGSIFLEVRNRSNESFRGYMDYDGGFPRRHLARIFWGRTLSESERNIVLQATQFLNWDFGSETDFTSYFREYIGYIQIAQPFPLINTSNGTNFTRTWENSVFTSFPELNMDNAQTVAFAWGGNYYLTSFPAIDLPNCTDFSYAWGGLQSIPSFPLIDTSSGLYFQGAWNYWQQLTSFPLLNTSNGINFESAWSNCSGLLSFPELDLSNGINFQSTWYNCFRLTSFPALDLSSGTDFTSTWRDCRNLTSFSTVDVSSGTNFNESWSYCQSLTSFPLLNVSNGTNFNGAWFGCSSLQNFPANMFDSVTATAFENAFKNTNLTQTSIDNILVSINNAGTSNGTFDQSGGSAPSAVGEAAIDDLVSRGWTVNVQGGYVPSFDFVGDFPGVKAAYSLRSLNDNITNVIRVLRVTDNAEQDFTAEEITDGTMLSWVTEIDPSSWGTVAKWYDQSGNGYDAVQPQDAFQPMIVEAGNLITRGGKPAVMFFNSWVFVDAYLSVPNYSTSVNLTASYFAVAEVNNGGNPQAIVANGVQANLQSSFGTYDGNLFISSNNEVPNKFTTLDTYSVGGLVYFSVISEPDNQGGRAYGYLNNSTETLNISVPMQRGGEASIGNWPPFNWFVPIAEFIEYDTSQKANDTAIRQNINDYYNIY